MLAYALERYDMKKKRVTMSDVAKEVGLAQSSISMILNQKSSSRFSQETVDRVYEACQRLGYEFNIHSSTNNSNIIMVMSENPTIPYYSQLSQQIDYIAHSNGYRVITCNINRSKELELSYLEIASKTKVAGVIFLMHPKNADKVNEMSKEMPIVAICDESDDLKIDIIEIDNIQASSLIIDHLVSLGHRKIALVTASPNSNLGRHTRTKGLISQMKLYHLEDSLFIYSTNVDPQRESSGEVNDYTIGYESINDSSMKDFQPTAFIGMSDVVARGIADALLERGFQIPEDYSICGYDNLLYSKLLPLSITTVDNHLGQRAQSAFELLQRNIDIHRNKPDVNFKNAQVKIAHPSILIVRKSTGSAKQ